MRSLPWVALSGLGLAGLSSALHLPLQRVRPRSTGSTPMSKTVSKGLNNTQNILYTAEVTVGTTTYTLQLDTGSSDLWFAPDKSYNQTFASAKIYEDLQLNLTYGTGWAAGAVAQIDVEFAGFSVKNQSFLFIEELSEWDVKFEEEYPIYQGIAGLSFDTLSQVNKAVMQSTNDTWGRSLLSNIFLSDTSTPNHVAFFLDRTGDLNDTDTGYFDIGSYAAGYEGVANVPKLEVFTVYEQLVGRWNVLVHGISVNGKDQTLKTTIKVDKSVGFVNVPPTGSIAALMDTGTSAGQIPEDVFHLLYKGMGGVLIDGTAMYAVPCMAEADVRFTIGNQSVAVHPLDLTAAQVFSDSNGQNLTACLSSYEPGSDGGGELDIILGDAFLRNVYAVYNYGDFVKTESGFSTSSPFIQILPLTDAEKASAEFKEARAKTLAALPPQVDVSTVNDPTPRPVNGTGSGSGSGTGGGGAAKIGAGASGSTQSLASSTGSDDDSEAVASLKKLVTLTPIALGLLGLSAALLIVLVVISGLTLVQLKKQATPSRAAAYVPVPLERERVGGYKDEPTKYDTQFRD